MVTAFSHAELLTAQVATNPGQDAAMVTEQVSSQQTVNSSEKALKRIMFLRNLKDQLTASNEDYKQISENVNNSSQQLVVIDDRVNTLQAQLANLDQQIETTKSLIENVSLQINDKETSIIKLYDQLELKKAAIEEQKKLLSEYLAALYEQENSVTDTMTANEEINIAKLLLSDVPVGEQLQQIKYFNIMEATGHKIFSRLEELYVSELTDQRTIEIQKSKLEELKQELDGEKRDQSALFQGKMQILAKTKGEESIYQQLYDQSKNEQDLLQEDIRTLRDNLDFIEQKMVERGDSFNPDDYKNLFDKNTTSVAEYIDSTKNNSSTFQPHWPVGPGRGISAYFHDEGYRKVFGFIHNAIDIRVPQGTLIRAPADGVVYKVRDNGFGYSYLILAHEGGFMTVYGHVSEFRVLQGDRVFQGQILGLTGGIPGTKGAGLMTTGAHLHFEMMKDGKYVDPLDYLELSSLPISTLPEKYSSRLTGADHKISRSIDQEITAKNDADLLQMVEQNAVIDNVVYGNTNGQ